MRTLDVALGARSYPIIIDRNLLGRHDLIIPRLASPRCFVVSNSTVAPLYLEALTKPLVAHGVSVASVVLADGEAYKTGETLNHIYDGLLTERADRCCEGEHE